MGARAVLWDPCAWEEEAYSMYRLWSLVTESLATAGRSKTQHCVNTERYIRGGCSIGGVCGYIYNRGFESEQEIYHADFLAVVSEREF
jgi:hypothetical protein